MAWYLVKHRDNFAFLPFTVVNVLRNAELTEHNIYSLHMLEILAEVTGKIINEELFIIHIGLIVFR